MNRDRLEVLSRLDRGEISADDALQAMREEASEEDVVPEVDSEIPAINREAEDGEIPAVNREVEEPERIAVEPETAVQTRRERLLALAGRVGDWEPRRMAVPQADWTPHSWPWSEAEWQWMWQDFEHPLHVDRSFDLAAGSGLWAVLYGGDLQLVGAEREGLGIGAAVFDLRVGRDADAIRVAASTGSLDLALPATVARIDARSLSGDIALRNLQVQELRLRGQGGDLRGEQVRAGRLDAQVEGGDVELREIEGEVEVVVSHGNIRVQGLQSTSLGLKTDGDIRLRLGAVDRGVFRCDTGEGDIEVELAAGTACELAVDAGDGGSVWAANLPWTEMTERSSQILRGNLGGGGAQVELKARGGRIFISEY